MKNALLPILLVVCGVASADTYNTVLHARISPTNRVVTSIPTWAQSATPPQSGTDTNDVNALIAKYNETNITTRINSKQDTLVSGTNIKTVNGNSLLGSGNIVIQGGGGTPSDYTTTNAVSGIITNHVTTGYLCTVAAAQAMTNDETMVRWDASGAAGQKLKHGSTEVTAGDVGALSTAWAGREDSNFMGTSRYAYECSTANNSYHLVGQQSQTARIRFSENLWEVTDDGFGTWTLAKPPSWLNHYYEDDPFDAVYESIDTKAPKTATETAIANLSATSATHTAEIDQWENYWRGDRVRLSVTNYYGNTSGELPRLRIEEFDHSTTTVVDNVQVISNFFHTVWDETDRQTNYMAQTDAKLGAISNSVMESAWRQTNLQLANKAPRAWQSVTSAGEDAPPNMVWHTAPNTVFAGGTEYAHVAVGEGSICVLTDRGAPVYTDGAEGQFRFQDQTGENYFGFDVRSSYKIGCRTDGISVDPAQHIVSLTYDLTSATDPSILYSTNLVDWADAEVEWEQNPPAGTKVCYINVGNQPKGFFQAEMRYTGGSKFLTNMQADLMGGIAASNQTLNIVQSVEPYIVSNQVMWRVKQ